MWNGQLLAEWKRKGMEVCRTRLGNSCQGGQEVGTRSVEQLLMGEGWRHGMEMCRVEVAKRYAFGRWDGQLLAELKTQG